MASLEHLLQTVGVHVLHEQNRLLECVVDGDIIRIAQFAQVQRQLFLVCIVGRQHNVPAVSIDNRRSEPCHLDVGVNTVTDSQEVSDERYVEILALV